MIDSRAIFNAVQRVAGTVGLVLETDPECKQPHTVPAEKKVVVPPLNALASEFEALQWRGYTYHEVGHNDPALVDMHEMYQSDPWDCASLYGRIMNVIEDWRNERNKHGRFPGRDTALAMIQTYHCKDGAEQIAKAELDEDMQLFVDVLGWGYHHRSSFQPQIYMAALKFSKYCDYSKFDHLENELYAVTTAQDVRTLTEKIIEASPNHDLEEEKQKAEPKESDSDGEGGDGDGGKSESSDEGDEKGSSATVSYEDLMGHVHNEADDGSLGGDVKIIYDHKPRTYVPSEKQTVVQVKNHSRTNRQAEKFYANGSGLSQQVRKLFQSKSQSLVLNGQKSGRLNKRDLYKIKGGNTELFSKKQAMIDPKGTAVFLLTDASGSMSGDPYWITAASAALMSDALSPVNIPLKIAAFTEKTYGPWHGVIKEWGDKSGGSDILSRYTGVSHILEQNADGESVLWAYHELMKRHEERKILIVLSDGYPATWNHGDAATHLTEVVKGISKQVECYGIGIESDSVKHFYPEYTVLRDMDQLTECLLNVIKTKIMEQ